MPGVPDVYQGCDLTDLSLVDPDNRRPVDYRDRRPGWPGWTPAAHPETSTTRSCWSSPGRCACAGRTPTGSGPASTYQPLVGASEHVVAFARAGEVVVVTARLSSGMAEDEATTVPLPAGAWRDLLTGSTHDGPTGLGALLGDLPVALLVRAG